MTSLTVIKKLVSSLRISAPFVCAFPYSRGSLSVGPFAGVTREDPAGAQNSSVAVVLRS